MPSRQTQSVGLLALLGLKIYSFDGNSPAVTGVNGFHNYNDGISACVL